MKDYYVMAIVVILNLSIFYWINLQVRYLIKASRIMIQDKIHQDKRNEEILQKIAELKTSTEPKGKSTNNWENAKNAFRTLPWGVKVENE